MNRWMNRDLLLAHQFPAGIQGLVLAALFGMAVLWVDSPALADADIAEAEPVPAEAPASEEVASPKACLLYTSPSPRDGLLSRMPSSA